jgi:hypothetical protein
MAQTIFTQSTGRLEAVLCVVLLFGITFFPTYFKTWFVESTGNIKIAPFLGFLLVFGVLFRKEWARSGATIFGWSVLAISAFSVVADSARPGFWILLVLAGFLSYLLHTERMKQYFSA